MSDISQITEQLYLASRLSKDDLVEIRKRNISLIISMIGQERPPKEFNDFPSRLLWLKSYDTFLTPVPIRKLKVGVLRALEVLQDKQNVLVFCFQGKRRSVTMAAAILIASGYTADSAIELLSEKREVILPVLWYVKRRIRKFEQYWKNQKTT
ncbi:MAG: dual specificity protein phosphatase family protein [Candidatus Omnitrophica bacterium]|nr:dual specificity protein phosphatase family protein [Candidatus Omnitrophota bacterium]